MNDNQNQPEATPPDIDNLITLDHLASDNPSKKQAIRERDIALARASTYITTLDGLVGCFEAAKAQLPPAGFELFRAFFEVEIRAAKLALVATQSMDLRARQEALTDAGFNQPAPEANETRPIWEAIVADLLPHATSPAAVSLLQDMRQRDQLGRKNYGVPLQAHNGRDALWDLYCEQLDSCAYAWQCIEENPLDYTLRQVYSDHVQLALATRRRILVKQMATRMEATDPAELIASLTAGRTPVNMDPTATAPLEMPEDTLDEE